MKVEWNSPQRYGRLALVFAGFAMDHHVFGLEHHDYNLAIVHSYHDLTWPEGACERLKLYERVDVACWSLGVWVYSQLPERLWAPGRRIAVAGTERPIDRDYGIAGPIFDRTTKSFDSAFQKTFYDRLDSKLLPQRTWQDQRSELERLQSMILNTPAQETPFDLAVVTKQDRIFPEASQLRYWKLKTAIRCVETGHAPFSLFRTWNEFFAQEGAP